MSKISVLLSSVFLFVASAAQAQEAAPPPVPKPASAFPWFVGIGAGVSYATVEHPQISAGGIAAPTFALNAGYTFGERLNVGLELDGTQMDIGRDTAGAQFRLGYSPQAECLTCQPKPPGGDTIATSLVFSTVGARVEYAPFGRDGLFVGGTAGLAFLVGLTPESGFGFGGRVGYRFRPTNIMTLSLEAGMSGQLYGDTTMYMPFGLASIRPYF